MRSHRIVPAFVVGWLIVAAAGWMPLASAEEAGDLDTLVAPIALYPDALVADILPASAYPVQVIEAARAVGDGGQVDASQASQWDPSVQALVDFPSVLAMMNDRIEWMTQLGQAVAEDQGAVLAAVQRVRAEAREVGNLQSNDKQTVVDEGDDLVIQPTDPQVVYVPQYDPVAILSPPPPWGYYPPVYGVVGFGDSFAIDPLDTYGIGWGFGPGFFGGTIIVINDHHHHHDHDYGHGHPDGHDGHGGGHAWRPPPRESVGHIGGMAGGVRGGAAPRAGGFGRPGGFDRPGGVTGGGRGLGGHAAAGGIPNRGLGLTSPPAAPGGAPAAPGGASAAPGGAFDHVGGGGWKARIYSARGAHSFGDGFGGGGWSHAGVGSGSGLGGMGGGHAGGFTGGGSGSGSGRGDMGGGHAGGFTGGGFGGGGHGGGGGGWGHR